GWSAEVRQLLADGADVTERGGQFNTTPLHGAAAKGDAEVVLLLLEHGADSSATHSSGGAWTPLHYAAIQCRDDVARLLLDNGAEVSARDIHGRSP
ncbi:ankyrin repeat-containing domain protein, partial [Baffinella frigidus]